MRKVLIVDDSRGIQETLAQRLRVRIRGLEVLSAFTLEEAQRLLSDNADIAVIVLDGCVPGHEPNTAPFALKAQENGYKGIIIGHTDHTEAIRQLDEVGCNTFFGKTEGRELTAKVAELING